MALFCHERKKIVSWLNKGDFMLENLRLFGGGILRNLYFFLLDAK